MPKTKTYTIKVEVPLFEGKPHCYGCPMQMVARFGTESVCRLYTPMFGAKDQLFLGYYEPNNPKSLIKPFDECLEQLKGKK